MNKLPIALGLLAALTSTPVVASTVFDNSVPQRTGFGYDVVKDLKVFALPSLPAADLTSYVNDGLTAWNAVTPNRVKVTRVTSGSYQVTIGDYPLPSNVPLTTLAQAIPFCPPVSLPAGAAIETSQHCFSPNSTMVSSAQIRLYKNGWFANSISGDTRKRVVAHELGHVLSLDHDMTVQGNFQIDRPIMSGIILPGTIIYFPRPEDQARLKERWGAS